MTMVVRSAIRSVERVLDQPLAFGIERAGGLVEEEQWRVAAEQGAGDGDALALAARQARAAFAHEGVEPFGKGAEEGLGIGVARRLPDLILAGVPIAVAQVVAGRGGEDHDVLRDHGDALADVGGIGVLEVDAVEQYPAGLRVVEALGELEDGGLARARWADHGEPLLGPHFKTEIVERRGVWAGRVAEADMVEGEPALGGEGQARQGWPAP